MTAAEDRTCIEPYFIPASGGTRFCLLHCPPASVPIRGALVYLHPFAEEMNKSRRTAAIAARRFAGMGWGVLQIDLMGCGDSDGELKDANWTVWRDDAKLAIAQLRSRFDVPVGLWGLRLGALLAADVARDDAMLGGPLMLWNPVANGKAFLTQFLRIAVAGAAFGRQDAAGSTTELVAKLAAGEVLEVGGYEIGPSLASDLVRLQIGVCRPAAMPVIWCETSTVEPAVLTAGTRSVVERWRAEGCDVTAVSVSGEPFWATLEIAEGRALVDAAADALRLGVDA